MIVWRFRGRASSFLSSRLFAKVTACRGRFASHSPIILQKSFLLTNIPIYAAEPFIFSIFALFLTSERPGSFNRPTEVVQSNGPGRSFGRPESFTYRKTLPREETNTLNALKPIDMAILYDWYENPGTNEEAPDVKSVRDDIPDALVAIINKAMVKDVDQRFQTGTEFANALKEFMNK